MNRVIATVMAATAICQFGVAVGDPADIFSSPAPILGSDPPKVEDLKDGDTAVSTQTGAAQYNFPIRVPPGRNRMAPSLSLSYSSQAPIYGSNLGAGWSLNVPRIEEDTSRGRLRTKHPGIEQAQGAAATVDDRFTSSIAGNRPLVLVTTDPIAPNVIHSYRAQNDTTFSRYQRMDASQAFRWRVLATDGSTMYFGDSSKAPGCPVTDGFAPLTRHVDAFGNEVAYEYVYLYGECMLQRIAWGQNAGAGLAEFAEVKLDFKRAQTCPGTGIEVGSARRYLTAPAGWVTNPPDIATSVLVVSGANRIDKVEINALEPGSGIKVHTRLITIGYSNASEDCSPSSGPLAHAPVRLVTSIQESAWGVDIPRVDLPANTFTYGPTMVSLIDPYPGPGEATPWAQYANFPGKNFAWGYRRTDDRWPTVEAMLLDIDGDGLPDRLHNASVTENGVTSCKATWQRNLLTSSNWGTPEALTFGDSGSARMPRLRWQGPLETGQVPNPGSEQADPSDNFDHKEGCALNGQVTAFHNSVPSLGVCHDNTACTPGSYCPDGNMCPDGSQPNNRTYLAYRWLDMDGDGLTDLVAAIHGSNQRYDIIRGNEVVGGGQPYEPALFGTVPIPGGLPSCTGLPQLCKALGTNCMNRIDTLNACQTGVFCEMDWSDINACEAAANDHQCEMEVGLRISGNDGNTPAQPGVLASARRPYRVCGGLYPWFIFKNRGNGNFSDTPEIKYQPVPLESDTGDSALIGPGIAATRQGVLDIDGDGLVDGVVQARDVDQLAHSWWWYVWLNDGTGQLGPTRYIWQGREHALGHINGIDSNAVDVSGNSMGLFDINGDGLVDHWHANPDPPSGPASANVALNDGTRFQLQGPLPYQSVNAGELEATIKPGSESQPYPGLVTETQNGKVFIISGSRYSQLRPFDIDGDGRADMFYMNSAAAQPELRFNIGGNFSTATPLPFPVWGVEQTMEASVNGLDRLWEVKTDLVDLDGDGHIEGAYWIDGVFHRARHDVAATGPLRLLRTVDNGRGALTTISYASMHSSSTSDPVVEQNPDELWAPGRPKASPRNQWVVSSLQTTDAFAGTSATTGYRYKNPRFGPDDEGRFAFRGFEEVRTISPSGMKTINRYGFDPDWSGRLVETLVVPVEAPGDVRSIDRTTWEARTLPNTSVTTFHATATEQFTCSNGQDEASCKASAAGYTRSESTLIAMGPVGALWVETGRLRKKQPGIADGDRETISTFELSADADTYRLRPRTVTRSHRVGGAMIMFAKSDSTWDPTLRVRLTEETWVDTVDANRAISRTVYDMSTGNAVERWKPVQNAAATKKTTLAYDSRKLFVASETNELGHIVDFFWEYGTGTRLRTDGPNIRDCLPANCPPITPTSPEKEQVSIKIDGLGRELERWETQSVEGHAFTLHHMSVTSYVDAAVAPTIPGSSTHQVKRSTQVSVPWTQVKTEYDGHGRTIRTIESVHGTAPADAITIFQYRDDGTLQTVSVPDPTQNNASLVAYSYGFDSLGRAISIRRPDAASATDQSGVNVAYDGLIKTVSEIVGIAGGTPAVTKTVTDSFGRLIEVHEQIQSNPATFATTHYTFGPDDRVSTIVDPEGVTTELAHDFAGRRTQIARHGRIWRYGYDKNGNMISEQVPGSPNPPVTDPDYTTTLAYDDLDRLSSKLVGQRNLSAADQQLFAGRTEAFIYDYGNGNMIGRPYAWTTKAPNTNTATIVRSMTNTDQGGESTRRVTFTGLAGLSGQRVLGKKFTFDNKLAEIRYYDSLPGSSNYTLGKFWYDERGLLEYVSALNMSSGQPATIIGVQTRNVAGLVTQRKSTTSGAMTFVESNWSFDKLGRVTSQVVQKGPGPVQIARQDLTYLGNDDPGTFAHTIGASAKQFQLAYDHRHQITAANESTTPGYFTSSYSYGAAGRFASATLAQAVPPPGSELRPRDVSYQYGDPDPERVTALVDVTTQTSYATYTYDEAGNQLSRCYGVATPLCVGESVELTYDGKDQLRRATRKNAGVVVGSEEYWYDGDGTRIAIVKRDANGSKVETLWFLGDVEASYDQTNTLVATRAHLSMGTPVARVKRSAAGFELEYLFHGLASHTLAAVSSAGTTNAAFSYSPFGEVLEAIDAGGSSGTDSHRRRFNDKHHDEISDLGYYGARYYDRVGAIWTQSDPLFRFVPDAAASSARRSNLYSFSLQNPLRYVDPDGRNPLKDLAWEFFNALCDGPDCDQSRDLAINDGSDTGSAAWAVAVSEGTYRALLGDPFRNNGTPQDMARMLADNGFVDSTGLGSEVPDFTDVNLVDIDGRRGRRFGADEHGNVTPPKTQSQPRERTRGSRMRASDGLGAAQDQLTGVSNAQSRARRNQTADDGTRLRGGDATIQSTKKSEDNLRNRTKEIKSSEDLPDDDLD